MTDDRCLMPDARSPMTDMRFRKRHLLWIFPLLFVITINVLPFLKFRDSDDVIAGELAKRNLTATFHDFSGERNIHYWEIAAPDKPLIMFVHGSPGSSHDLMGIAAHPLVAENFTSVMVDRPGFGYSDFGNAEKSLAKQSELLGAILKKDPNKRKILVGHSLGGPVIARMAMDFPEEISAIVILAGSIDPILEPDEWFRKPMASPLIRWMIPTAFRASNDEIMDLKLELESMLPDWKKIRIPVVVVQGTADDLVPAGNADFAKKVLINAPVKLRMLEGESHFFPFMRPEIVAEELNLLRHDASSRPDGD